MAAQLGRCSYCKWWQDTPEGKWDNIAHPVDPDTYEPIPTDMLGFEVRRCASPKLIKFERPLSEDGASVCDGSKYHAALYTAGQFGCINFESEELLAHE